MEEWAIVISAPTGDIKATLSLSEENGFPVGEMAGKSGVGPMRDLKFDETNISWSTKIERPMPMKLTFRGERKGDVLSGEVKFGIFASGTFVGSKLSRKL